MAREGRASIIDARRLELYRREADHWLMFETDADRAPLKLDSVGLELNAAEAFEDLVD